MGCLRPTRPFLLALFAAFAAAPRAEAILEFPLSANRLPQHLALGPDGALWFTESSANAIGRITTAGIVTEFPTPTTASNPYAIVSGSDGNLWINESGAGKIGRFVIGEGPLPAVGGRDQVLEQSLFPAGSTSGGTTTISYGAGHGAVGTRGDVEVARRPWQRKLGEAA